MSFKGSLIALLFFAGIMSPLFAEERYKVLVSNWEDLSKSQDKTIGTMIQRSISAQMDKKSQFLVNMDTNTNINTRTIREARIQGITNRSDVIIYGSFYVEKERLFVITEVYDILKNQLKLRKAYEGAITVDIFDTIDQMAADTIRKVEEVLPVLTVDSEVEIKKLRETIYETKAIQLKRLFYTRIGLMSGLENGPTATKNGGNGDNTLTTNYNSIQASHLEFGIVLRIWDIRYDGMFQLLGAPGYNYTFKHITTSGIIPAYMQQALYYCLPWDGGKWAAGIGFVSLSHFQEYDTNNVGNEYQTDGSFDTLVSVIYSPWRDLELNLSVGLPIPSNNTTQGVETGPTNKYYTTLETHSYTIPPLVFSVTGFVLGDLGIEAQISYSYWNYMSKDTFNSDGSLRNFSSLSQQTFTAYLGVAYRVDFLDSK